MTNKKIIVDGIDVSGCKYLFDDTSYKRSKTSCSITLKDCKYLGNNCYYKQLRRKEQECETLGQAYLETNELLQEKTKECTNLKAELEQYKDLANYKQLRIIENIKNFKEVEIAYKENLKLCKYQEEQINKLATCIEEIKEIAETEVNNRMLFADKESFCDFNKILQKISEVK